VLRNDLLPSKRSGPWEQEKSQIRKDEGAFMSVAGPEPDFSITIQLTTAGLAL
jgi:hypothetical protein